MCGKVFLRSNISHGYGKQMFVNEIEIHKKLQHPNICKFECFFEDFVYFVIVMEQYENGTL